MHFIVESAMYQYGGCTFSHSPIVHGNIFAMDIVTDFLKNEILNFTNTQVSYL